MYTSTSVTVIVNNDTLKNIQYWLDFMYKPSRLEGLNCLA